MEVLLRMSRGGTTTLCFDGRMIAGKFGKAFKSGIYRSIAELEKLGWLEPININRGEKRAHAAGGSPHYVKREYRVLNHEEWVAQYGTTKCNDQYDGITESNALTSCPLGVLLFLMHETTHGFGEVFGGRVTTYQQLAEAIGCPVRSVRRYVGVLRKDGYVILQRASKGLVFSIPKLER